MEYSLLNKTELRLTEVYLQDCDLSAIARTVASVLGLPADRVFVIDVREDHIALDLLVQSMEHSQFVGKETDLLQAVGSLPGVRLGSHAGVHSEGVLGMIALTPAEGMQVAKKSLQMGQEIQSSVRRRVKVFPTGFEVIERMIEDTNTPYLVKTLGEADCIVHAGDPLPDDVDVIAGAFRRAVEAGFGWIITTGGVGAEDKDFSVEALLRVCPDAATPYIVKFGEGGHRHVKDGIRIGVGKVGLSYIVTFPGPHDEVRLCTDMLLSQLLADPDPIVLAEQIAHGLRERWRNTVGVHQKGRHHHA